MTLGLVMFVDAYVSIQNVHSYSPHLYSTLTSDATFFKVIDLTDLCRLMFLIILLYVKRLLLWSCG